ncbi:hypothetical protein ACFFX0_25220 [Citricoccus parietis]|uniref:Secreted protein n=1 Tax=Citricoccus parietis TaxID=592307 RepID=A0ABV5G5T8_9MICC
MARMLDCSARCWASRAMLKCWWAAWSRSGRARLWVQQPAPVMPCSARAWTWVSVAVVPAAFRVCSRSRVRCSNVGAGRAVTVAGSGDCTAGGFRVLMPRPLSVASLRVRPQ